MMEVQEICRKLKPILGAKAERYWLAEVVPSSRSRYVPLLKTEVDLERGTVTTRTAKCKPGSRSEARQVSICPELSAALKCQIEQTPGPHVFPRYTMLPRSFSKVVERAGIPKVSPLGERATLHSFRHTYGTLAAEAVGNNLFLVQKMLGHKQISTTARCCHRQAPHLTAIEEPILRNRNTNVGQNVGQVIELAFGKAG